MRAELKVVLAKYGIASATGLLNDLVTQVEHELADELGVERSEGQ